MSKREELTELLKKYEVLEFAMELGKDIEDLTIGFSMHFVVPEKYGKNDSYLKALFNETYTIFPIDIGDEEDEACGESLRTRTMGTSRIDGSFAGNAVVWKDGEWLK